MPDSGGLLGLSQRLPPQNLQAEQSLLGALLANNRSYERVADFLEPRHFADRVHAAIYRRIGEKILNGQAATAVSLKADLENAGILDAVGGTEYLSQLLASMVAINLAGEYGRAILDCWLRRQLIDLGESIVNLAFGADEALDARRQIEAAESALAALNAGGRRGDRMTGIGVLVDAAIARAEAVYKGSPSSRLLTGMETIDRAVRLLPGTLTLLAGPPGAGKTALAVQMGKSVAKMRGAAAVAAGLGGADVYRQPGVAVFSLEMSGDELADRVAAHEAQISLEDFIEGRLDMASAANLARAQSALEYVPLRIWDCTATPLRLIPRKIRMHLSSQPELLVIVDHLLVTGDDDGGKRGYGAEAATIGALAGAFKSLARETGLPFLVLTHTARPVKGVEVRRPVLTDVKYSGEGVADNVVFVHRPILFMDTTEPTIKRGEGEDAFKGPRGRLERWRATLDNARDLAEIVVAKQRQGRTDVYPMTFRGRTTSFAERNSFDEGGQHADDASEVA